MQKNNHFVSDHLRKYFFVFSSIIFIGLLNNIVSFLLPISIGEFFTLHFHTGSSKGKLLNWLGLNVNTTNHFFVLFWFLLFTKTVLTLVESYGTFKQGELFAKNLREKVFSAQMGWGAATFLDRSYGKYLLRYSNDMKSVQNYLTKGIIDGITNSLFLLTGFFLLIQINLKLTMLLVLLLLVIIFLIYQLASWQIAYIKSSRTNRSSMLSYVAHQFGRFKKIKEKQTEQKTVDNFLRRSDNLFHANMKYNATESLLKIVVPVLIFGMIGILLWRMKYLLKDISASEGLMMVLILLMMQGAIRKILKVPTYLNKGRISLEKICKLLQEPIPETPDTAETT